MDLTYIAFLERIYATKKGNQKWLAGKQLRKIRNEMKTSIVFSEGTKQIIFTPENDDERQALKMITPDDNIKLLTIKQSNQMTTEQEITTTEIADVQTIYQQDKAAIDVQISTAKAYPRNVKRSIDNSIALVTMDKETASTCTYSVPRGGKAITGPSVHLAKILAQNWGNMRVEAKVISIEGRQLTSQAIAFDLENNLAIKVEVKRSIMGKTGRFNDDMITVTGNAANSIALRNAVLSVIPKAVVDKVYNEAKKTITGDVSDKTKLIARRKQVFDGFKDTYEVSESEVLSSIGKAALDHVTGDDLVVLIGIAQAIKDGETSVDTAFRNKKGTPAVNEKTKDQHEAERVELLIEDAKTPAELERLLEYCITDEQKTLYKNKLNQLLDTGLSQDATEVKGKGKGK